MADLLAEFPAHWSLEGHRRGCPKCGAGVGELCVAADGTEAAGGLCHAERETAAVPVRSRKGRA